MAYDYPQGHPQSDKTLLGDTHGAHARDEKPNNGDPEPSKHRPRVSDAQWWRAEEQGKKPHDILDGVISQIERDQDGRYNAYREYERLFGASIGQDGDDSLRSIASEELSQNELQSALETLWAQIFKNRIVPAVSTSEADWDEWDRARAYSRWLEGAFDDARVYEDAWPDAGMKMLVHGTGIIRVGWEKVDKKTAKVVCWSVNPRFASVDRMEGKHGKPRSIYFKDHIDRFKLFETYKDAREDFYGSVEERLAGIDDCTSNDDTELRMGTSTKCDMLTVREAFHLPSGPDADDGCHAIWIKGCTLVYEEFGWDTFPAVFMRYGAPMEGFYGESAVKKLAPSQKNLDKLNIKLDECQDVMGVPRIIVGDGAGEVMKTEHLDDIPGAIIRVGNINQIKDWNAQCATPELYRDRDELPRKMRSLLGVSDFEAQNQLPQGLRDVSGAMLERWVDQGAARHAMTHAQAESAIVDLAGLFMRQAEDLQKMGFDVVYMGPGEHSKSSIEELSFKAVHVDRKRMRVRVQPMSQLPQTFAGKVEALGKIEEKFPGAMNSKTVLRMLEVPDISSASDMLVSDEEIIMKNLSYMCKTGEYLAPMPFDNLDLIIQLTTRYINRYRVREGRDLNRISLLAQYIDDAVQLKNGLGGPDPNAPPSPTTMGAILGGPMGPPPGMGMPPQVPPMGAGPMAPPPGGPPPGMPMGMPPPNVMPAQGMPAMQ